MFKRLVALVALASALADPAAALGHAGGEATLIVPVDHVNPGETFPVIAADLGSDAQVVFQLAAASRTIELGTVQAGPDGHFESSFNLPADFPLGYANLIASADDGSTADTWILVGPRTGSTPTSPGETQWWQDPSIWLLSGLLLGGGLLLAWTTLRSQRKQQVAVPSARPPSTAKPPRRRQRRR